MIDRKYENVSHQFNHSQMIFHLKLKWFTLFFHSLSISLRGIEKKIQFFTQNWLSHMCVCVYALYIKLSKSTCLVELWFFKIKCDHPLIFRRKKRKKDRKKNRIEMKRSSFIIMLNVIIPQHSVHIYPHKFKGRKPSFSNCAFK